MRLLSIGVVGALLLMPAAAQAQKATTIQLPTQKRLVATKELGDAASRLVDERRRLRELEQHMGLLLADARDVAQGLREAAVGVGPALDSVGRTPGRDTGRAVDRVGPGTGAQGSQYENPMGSTMSGIDGRLRGKKPRSSVVGPGGMPSSGGVVSSGWVSNMDWFAAGSYGRTTTTHDPRSGATVRIDSHARDASTGQLIQWSETSVDRRGNTTTTYHRVDHRGPNGDVPVVVEHTQTRDGDGEVTSEGEETERDYEPGKDPPIAGPTADSHTAEEGVPGGLRSFEGPLGMSCNPITGVCGPGLKLGSAQVNPGRLDGQAVVGPRVRLDPRAPVINPDPNALENARTPNAIDRDGKGPGAIPPKPQ